MTLPFSIIVLFVNLVVFSVASWVVFDNIIVEAGWKSLRDIQKMQHAYPEDLEVLESLLK